MTKPPTGQMPQPLEVETPTPTTPPTGEVVDAADLRALFQDQPTTAQPAQPTTAQPAGQDDPGLVFEKPQRFAEDE